MRGKEGGSDDVFRLLLGLPLHDLVEAYWSRSPLPQIL